MRLVATAALAVLASACVPRAGEGGGPRLDTLAVGDAVFRIEYQPEDESSARAIKEALPSVAPRAQRWGRLTTPVVIAVHPTHDALELAVRRESYPWLRAWARHARIDLQSPRTWTILGADRGQLEELLLHELTHCAMYQAAGDAWSWSQKGIPMWFREGMASVTAGQAYRRGGPEILWLFYASPGPVSPGSGDGVAGGVRAPGPRRGGDPVSDPEPLYQDESEIVYCAAHHAFQFLLDRYGEGRVRRLLARMGDGDSFAEAFHEVMGISTAAFEADFRRFIVWRGWKQE